MASPFKEQVILVAGQHPSSLLHHPRLQQLQCRCDLWLRRCRLSRLGAGAQPAALQGLNDVIAGRNPAVAATGLLQLKHHCAGAEGGLEKVLC